MTDHDEKLFYPHVAYPLMRDTDRNTNDCKWKSWQKLTSEEVGLVLRGLRHGDRRDRAHLPEFEAFVCAYADDLRNGMTLGEAVANSG